MSTLYRVVPELLFSMRWWRKLSTPAKLVLLTIVGGPCMSGCPGLVVADSYVLESLVGLGLPTITDALAELVQVGVVEVDEDHRLMRMPWLPRMRTTASNSTLEGWFNVWRELPDCPMRTEHIASLREGLEFTPKNTTAMNASWSATFGSIRTPANGAPAAGIIPLESERQKRARKALDDFDHRLEPIYQLYPRRENKVQGFKKLRSELRTEEDFAQFRRAVENYAARCKREGTETKFIKMFSTFATGWREWIEPPLEVAGRAAIPTGPRQSGDLTEKL